MESTTIKQWLNQLDDSCSKALTSIREIVELDPNHNHFKLTQTVEEMKMIEEAARIELQTIDCQTPIDEIPISAMRTINSLKIDLNNKISYMMGYLEAISIVFES